MKHVFFFLHIMQHKFCIRDIPQIISPVLHGFRSSEGELDHPLIEINNIKCVRFLESFTHQIYIMLVKRIEGTMNFFLLDIGVCDKQEEDEILWVEG
jgi:hypothetical protein